MVVSIINLAVTTTVHQVPDSNRFVVCAAHKVLAVRVENEVSYPVVVANQSNHADATLHLEDADLLVPASGGKVLLEFSLLDSECLLLLASVDDDVVFFDRLLRVAFNFASQNSFSFFEIVLQLGNLFSDGKSVLSANLTLVHVLTLFMQC